MTPRDLNPGQPQVTVIPGVDSLIGDLLDMDINPPMHQHQFGQQPPLGGGGHLSPLGGGEGGGGMDLLSEGFDNLVSLSFPPPLGVNISMFSDSDAMDRRKFNQNISFFEVENTLPLTRF